MEAFIPVVVALLMVSFFIGWCKGNVDGKIKAREEMGWNKLSGDVWIKTGEIWQLRDGNWERIGKS